MSTETKITHPLEKTPDGAECLPVLIKGAIVPIQVTVMNPSPAPAVYNPLVVGKYYELIANGFDAPITGECVERRFQFANIKQPQHANRTVWINTSMIQKIVSGDLA